MALIILWTLLYVTNLILILGHEKCEENTSISHIHKLTIQMCEEDTQSQDKLFIFLVPKKCQMWQAMKMNWQPQKKKEKLFGSSFFCTLPLQLLAAVSLQHY